MDNEEILANPLDSLNPMDVNYDQMQLTSPLSMDAEPVPLPAPVTFDAAPVPMAPVPAAPIAPAPVLTPEQIAQTQANLLSGLAPAAPAAAPVAAPVVVPQTATTTSSEQKIMPAGTKKAMATYDEAVKKQQQAADAEAKAQMDRIQKEAEYQQKLAESSAQVADKFAQSYQEADRLIAADQAALDNRITEFANQKNETFWGSKTEGDRIAAAVSVGLGSLGQALLGSKENVGMALLKRNMDEFANNQQAEYNRQLKGIENQKLSIDQKMDAKKMLKMNFDAQSLAATEKVKAALGQAVQLAKLPEIAAKAQKMQADLDASASLKRADIFKDYAETRKTVATKQAYQQLASGISPDQRKASLQSAEEMRKGLVKKLNAVNILDKVLKLQSDPKVPYDVKLSSARLAVKDLMGENKEALGDREREYYASILENTAAKIAKTAVAGAAAVGGTGAAAGTMLGGPGIGTAVGGVLGAGLGLLGAGTYEAINAATSPGGIQFAPDLPGFANLASETAKRFDAEAKFAARVIELVEKEGIDVMQANIIAKKEEEAALARKARMP